MRAGWKLPYALWFPALPAQCRSSNHAVMLTCDALNAKRVVHRADACKAVKGGHRASE